MKMTFRWFGAQNDSVSLSQIRQIPGISGVVWALYDRPAGDRWSSDSIAAQIAEIHAAGLEAEVVESVNIHEDIKLGLPSRDLYIENYIRTIEALGKAGVRVVCYNFMPIFDWFRTDLAWRLPDGSSALYFGVEEAQSLTAEAVVKKIGSESKGFLLPGWEPERLSRLTELFAAYEGISSADLLGNLKYFLDAVIPVCEKVNVRMAIHPDDPPWNIFGLPRIVRNRETIDAVLGLHGSPFHGLTFCSGSLGASRANDLPQLARRWADRIPFAHLRNIRFLDNGDFHESAHWSPDGSLDMCAIVQAFVEADFQGYVRPDHGRMIWDEKARPGYGLYDRAIGANYLLGLFEGLGARGLR